jgi:hypothetical protein
MTVSARSTTIFFFKYYYNLLKDNRRDEQNYGEVPESVNQNKRDYNGAEVIGREEGVPGMKNYPSFIHNLKLKCLRERSGALTRAQNRIVSVVIINKFFTF